MRSPSLESRSRSLSMGKAMNGFSAKGGSIRRWPAQFIAVRQVLRMNLIPPVLYTSPFPFDAPFRTRVWPRSHLTKSSTVPTSIASTAPMPASWQKPRKRSRAAR